MLSRLFDLLRERFLLPGTAAAAVGSNAAWLMLDKMARAGLALTVGAWVARQLGPTQFGELSYAVTLIVLFQGVCNLGADGLIVRDIARSPDRAAEILGTAFRLRLLAGLGCWAAATGLVALLRPQDTQAILLTAIVGASLVFQAADTIDLWFQSQSRNAYPVRAKLAAYTVANVVRVGMLLNNAPLWAFALAAVVDAAALAGALAVVYSRSKVQQAWHHSWVRAWRLLRESAPFMVSGVAALLYMRIDQIMIREMLGEEALGIYSAAVPLSHVWAVVPVALATALAPFVARKKAEGEVAYMSAIARVFQVFAAISVLVTMVTALLAEPLVFLLYGQAYAAAAPVLALHVMANVFIFMGVAQGLWLINEGHGRMTLYRTGLGAVVCIAGNWLLIPRFGLMGSAAVTVLAQFVAAVASNALFAPRILKLQMLAFVPPLPWRRPGR